MIHYPTMTARNILIGQMLANTPPPADHVRPGVLFPDRNGGAPFQLTYGTMSRGTVVLGGTGSGKTVSVFGPLIDQTLARMTSRDILLIFDSKGDFHERIRRSATPDRRVVVISADPRDSAVTAHWNIYEELLCSPTHADAELMAKEFAYTFFDDEINHSQNPFFGNAAADIFSFILIDNLRHAWQSGDYSRLNNALLAEEIRTLTMDGLHNRIARHRDFTFLTSYIGAPGTQMTPMTLSVLAVLQDVMGKTFIGPFAKAGKPFSMSRIHRDRGRYPKGAVILLKYSMRYGNALEKIYMLMVEQLAKEVMDGPDTLDNSFFYLDELPLVPIRNLSRLCNFGRSKGCKTVCGLQAIPQLDEKFGAQGAAAAVLAGFTSCIAFHCVDEESRSYVSNRFGKTLEEIIFAGTRHIQEGHLIRDCDQRELPVGEAFIDLPGHPPFRFAFARQ